jgi:hypothetical protein
VLTPYRGIVRNACAHLWALQRTNKKSSIGNRSRSMHGTHAPILCQRARWAVSKRHEAVERCAMARQQISAILTEPADRLENTRYGTKRGFYWVGPHCNLSNANVHPSASNMFACQTTTRLNCVICVSGSSLQASPLL